MGPPRPTGRPDAEDQGRNIEEGGRDAPSAGGRTEAGTPGAAADQAVYLPMRIIWASMISSSRAPDTTISGSGTKSSSGLNRS